jgi:hypothetical protein
MAGGNGFEPLLDAPEASVLPLDEPPIFLSEQYSNTPLKNKQVKIPDFFEK